MSFLQHISAQPHTYAIIETPLGDMIAIANEKALALLTFVDSVSSILREQLERLKKSQHLVEGSNKPLQSIEAELTGHFRGTITSFATPIEFCGTDFQKTVWHNLMMVRQGVTQTYTDLAIATGDKKAVRAVAQANARNKYVIIVPCHRIIAKNGKLGGYSCGLVRKQWLLAHERTMKKELV